MNIISGNAITDGSEFRFWIVGDIEKWCRQKGIPFDAGKYGIRNDRAVEVKWGIYSRGDSRTEWASASDMTGISILIRGDCIFRFREAGNPEVLREVRVSREGDYVMWEEDLEHTWQMIEDSVFVTIRWHSSGRPR
jgi:hypothetical protein